MYVGTLASYVLVLVLATLRSDEQSGLPSYVFILATLRSDEQSGLPSFAFILATLRSDEQSELHPTQSSERLRSNYQFTGCCQA